MASRWGICRRLISSFTPTDISIIFFYHKSHVESVIYIYSSTIWREEIRNGITNSQTWKTRYRLLPNKSNAETVTRSRITWIPNTSLHFNDLAVPVTILQSCTNFFQSATSLSFAAVIVKLRFLSGTSSHHSIHPSLWRLTSLFRPYRLFIHVVWNYDYIALEERNFM
jgi:hypothetical protein